MKFFDLVRINGLIFTEDSKDKTHNDRRFRGSNAHDKKGNDLPDSRIGSKETVEGHKVHTGAIEDQFSGDQHADKGPVLDQPVNSGNQEKYSQN